MAWFILVTKNIWRKKTAYILCCSLFLAQHRWINFGCAYHYTFSSPLSLGLCVSQEQQVVVYQMLQQQRQRELQRLTLTGALTPTAQSPNLGASPLQGGQGNPLFGLQENALHKPGVSADMQLFETPYLNRPLYMSILDQLKL